MREDPGNSGSGIGRHAVLERAPDGRELRIVVAQRGSPLRNWSITTGPVSFVVELLVELLLAARTQDTAVRKVAVFTVRKVGYEKRVYRTVAIGDEAASRLVEELAEEIRAGSPRWARAE